MMPPHGAGLSRDVFALRQGRSVACRQEQKACANTYLWSIYGFVTLVVTLSLQVAVVTP